MKKKLLLIIAVLLNIAVKAQTTITIEAGGLQSALNGQVPAHLIVKGKMNEADFTYLKGFKGTVPNMPSILDLSNVVEMVFPSSRPLSSTGLKEVILPNFIEILPNGLFYNCSNLTKVTLPNRLKKISRQAFYACSSLSSINLPETVEEIHRVAFTNCSSLTSINIPAGLKILSGDNVFDQCSKLTSITLPENVYISQYNPTTDVELADKVGVMDGTFQSTGIINALVPKNAKVLNGTYQRCSGLKTVVIPEGVTTLNATFTATSLVEVVIPNSVVDLGSNTFSEVSTLKKITLGSKLDKIGSEAFLGCTNLQTIISLSDFPPIVGEAAFNNVPVTTTVLYVPAAAINAYKQADGWKNFVNIKAIGSDANNQTIANFDDMTTTVGATVDLTATASSNLPVTYTIADPTIATLSGNKLTILKVGETTITAKQAGDGVNHLPVEKTVKLIVVSYDWLEEATITVEGNKARVVGPATAAAKFTKFFINNTEVQLADGKADLTGKTGEIELKATSADGSETIKLKITK